MALVVKDRVKEQTTTTGTGSVTLGGAVSGFQTFGAAVGNANTTYYAIVHQTADEWEVGLGTYTAAGTLLSRDTILESTNSDAAVNFSAGTKDVFVTYPSDKAIYADGSGNVGIGTASPDRLFEVDEASGDAYIRLRASDTGGGADTIFENLCADNGQNNYIYFGDLDDVNIGIIRYSHASDFMSFTTNATERMRITSTGNVGIGTSSPGGDLHIQGAVGNQVRLYLTDGDATGTGNSLLISKSGTLSYVSDRQAGSSLFFGTADTERMRIDSSGRVGIGTSSPASRLTVSDGSSGLTPFSDTDVFIDSNGSNYLQFGSGISSSPAIYFGDSADGDAGGIIYSHATDAMSFRANAAERMRIDSSGNVGIGTTSPSTKLHVVDSTTGGQLIVASTGTDSVDKVGTFATQHYTNAEEPVLGLAIQSTSTENKVFIGGVFTQFNAATEIRFYTASNNTTLGGSERMRIDSSGNVLIGTTTNPASQRMAVLGGGVQFSGGTSAQEGLRIQRASGYASITGINNNNNAFNAISFFTGGTAALHITTGNNVGIGTSSPAKQLEITKSARAIITSLTDATSITSDFDTAQNFAVTLGGNRTLENPSNIDPGQTGSIFVVQDGTGGRTLSFGSYWKFAGGTAPTLSTAVSAVDRIDYVVYTSTAIHAVASLNIS
jgi:hypothetical protein